MAAGRGLPRPTTSSASRPGPTWGWSAVILSADVVQVTAGRRPRSMEGGQGKGWAMPNFWTANIEFAEINERFEVKARPNGLRGNRALSWIPYRTGKKLTATIEVRRLEGHRPVNITCELVEPDRIWYPLIQPVYGWELTSDEPFKCSTRERYLAMKGEYVLGVDVAVTDHGSTFGPFNRRLITLDAFSQDVSVSNIWIGIIGAIAGATVTFVSLRGVQGIRASIGLLTG